MYLSGVRVRENEEVICSITMVMTEREKLLTQGYMSDKLMGSLILGHEN